MARWSHRGFRQFNQPGPRAPGAPEYWGHRKMLGKILRKIIKIVAIRWRILRLKCTKFDFGWGSAPDPAPGAYSAPQTPLLDLDAASRQGRGWAGEEEGKREGKGREGEVERREREGPQVTVEPGPLRALLRHWEQGILFGRITGRIVKK